MSHSSSLNNGVLFSVKSHTEFVSLSGRHIELLPEASSPVFTVLDSSRRTVVSRSNGMLVLNYDSAHISSHTGRSLRRKFGHFHKILIPARSVHFFLQQIEGRWVRILSVHIMVARRGDDICFVCALQLSEFIFVGTVQYRRCKPSGVKSFVCRVSRWGVSAIVISSGIHNIETTEGFVV